MTNTVLDVFNMAMHHVGTRDDIADPNEKSRPAEVCRLLYPRVRDQVLRAAYWGSAKGYSRLAVAKEKDDSLVWGPTDPEPGFRFAYALPSDFLYPRYLSTYERFSTGTYANAKALFANGEAVILFYTRREETVALWDDQLFMAMTYALAAHACMPLNGKPSRAQFCGDQANNFITEARVSDANSEDVQLDTMPEWLAARGYAGGVPSTRFFYPYGPMINAVSPA